MDNRFHAPQSAGFPGSLFTNIEVLPEHLARNSDPRQLPTAKLDPALDKLAKVYGMDKADWKKKPTKEPAKEAG